MFQIRRSIRWGAAAAVVAVTLGITTVLPETARADSSYPTMAAANARTAPTTTAPIVTVIPQGYPVSIQCVAHGQFVNGTDLWDYVPRNGWVSDSLVRTGTDDAVAPLCSAKVTYNRAAAVSWALQNAYAPSRFENDCTWYVSQALWRGGLPETADWTAESNNWFKLADKWGGVPGPTKAAASADYLKNALQEAGYGELREVNVGDPSAGGAQLGDVVFYDWNNGPDGEIDHAAIVTAIRGDGTVVISQHSPARPARVWDEHEDHTKLVNLRVYVLHITA